MKFIATVVAILFLLFVGIGVAHGQEITHEFDDILIELNSQDYKATVASLEAARQDLDAVLKTCKSAKPPQIARLESLSEIPESLPLSERLTLIKRYVNEYTAIVADSTLALTESTETISLLMQKHSVLMNEYDKLVNILQRMSKSQMEDLGVASDQIGSLQQEVQDLRLRLKMINALEQKQYDKISALQKSQKRLRVGLAASAGVGLGMVVLSQVLPEDSNARGFVLGAGAAALGVGAAGLIISIAF